MTVAADVVAQRVLRRSPFRPALARAEELRDGRARFIGTRCSEQTPAGV